MNRESECVKKSSRPLRRSKTRENLVLVGRQGLEPGNLV